MNVCMYIYAYIFSKCIYTYTHICIYTCTYVCMYVCMYVY